MRRLWTALSPYKLLAAVALGCGAAAVGANLALVSTSAYLIAKAARHPSNVLLLGVPLAGVRFFGTLRGVARYGERYFSHDVTFRILKDIRMHVYHTLEPLAPSRLKSLHSGDLLMRAVSDVDTMQNIFLGMGLPSIVAVVSLILAWFIAWLTNAVVADVLAIGLFAVGVTIPFVFRRESSESGKRNVGLRAEISSKLVEVVQGMEDTLALNAESRVLAYFQSRHQEWRALQKRLNRVSGIQTSLFAMATHLVMVGILLLGVHLASEHRIPGVLLPVVVLLSIASFEAIQPLPSSFRVRGAVVKAAQRLVELEKMAPAISVPPEPNPLPAYPGIMVHGVWFRYSPKDPWILKGLTAQVPFGKHVALVGPNGIGKSSVLGVLTRLWDFERGNVSLDGVDIRSCHPDQVRSLFSVVTQFPHVFDRTLRENICVARPRANEREILDALEVAQLRELVANLPQGLDTPVGEHGLALSGGERKRLAVARAVLKDSPILFLDEPTEGLDSIKDRDLLAALVQRWSNRTILWITHRLANLDLMDEVWVMRHGRVNA